MRVLLIDHHDSYAHILRHLLYQAGAHTIDVFSHDDPALLTLCEDLTPEKYQLIVLSPGPGHPSQPSDVGYAQQMLSVPIPLWGVCLGHQIMGVYAGASLSARHEPHHGIVSMVEHNGTGLWEGIPSPTPVVRYHSLALDDPLPSVLTVTGRVAAEDGRTGGARTIMSLESSSLGCPGVPRWGVQFHPESIDTPAGVQMARNVLRLAHQWCAQQGDRTTALTVQLPASAIAQILQDAAQPHEDFRWLDDSLTELDGDTTQTLSPDARRGSILALCSGPIMRTDEELSDACAHNAPATGLASGLSEGFSGWLGYRSYSGDQMNFRHTVLSVTGASPQWTVQCADVTRRQELCAAILQAEKNHKNTDTPPPQVTHQDHSLYGPSPSQYADRFHLCQHYLRQGESYELCLTDRYVLPRQWAHTPWTAYQQLRRECPTHFGAFMAFSTEDSALLSASPELFLRITSQGRITTRPMKGTAPRSADPHLDAEIRATLAADPKTRSENLMIIDLSRSDLARVCQPGSIHVVRDREVETFRTVHQLISEVQGQLPQQWTLGEVFAACCPPASMTGAPKERTIQLLDEIEQADRGIYSGVVGYVADNGETELSVIIRTAVYDADAVTVGAGGAITMDSTCSAEYEEVQHKASYVMSAVMAPAQDTDLLVMDSFYLRDGHHGGYGDSFRSQRLHQERFAHAVARLFGEDEGRKAATFYEEQCAQLPSSGEFFPLLTWTGQGGSAELQRPCPPLLSSIATTLGPVDPRRLPSIKGPDRTILADYRRQAESCGAHEMVLCDRWGRVLEGTHSSILWWDGDILCGPPHDAVLTSTMRQQFEEDMAAQGYRVEERWLPLQDLPHYRALSVNALHGVRTIDQWIENTTAM